MAAGKQRRALSLAEKVDVIHRVESGEKKSNVPAAFGIPRSTLSTILKNRSSIVEKACERPNSDNKRIRKPAYDEVEKTLYQWFLDIRARNLPVSSPMLQQKAKDLAVVLGVEDFTAGTGWLQRFKDRYGIVGKVVAGEGATVDMDIVSKWVSEKWPDITSRYNPSDIFNTDETALFWQLLLSRTLVHRNDKCHGGNHNKVRITILLATNLDASSNAAACDRKVQVAFVPARARVSACNLHLQ